MKSILPTIRHDLSEELEIEASFWRDMISDYVLDDDSLQRARDALMLVEYKLSQMTDSYH